MSNVPFDLRIDSQGTLESVRRRVDGWPVGIDRARQRAMRKLSTWVQRQVLRAVSRETKITQKTLKALVRYRVTRQDAGLRIWLGTDPVKVHHLGAVRWTRRMQGARVGRRLFPGSFSWTTGPTTGLVMERVGRFGRRNPRTGLPDPRLERIDVVSVPIHALAVRAVASLQPLINDRLQTLLIQEINYELLRERGAV